MKVMAFIDNDGNVTDMMAATRMVKYELIGDQWEPSASAPLLLNATEGLSSVRSRMPSILDFCWECDAVVAAKMTGVMCFELARAGCSLWEVSGPPAEFLEKIRSYDDCACISDDPQAEEAVWPEVETLEPGHLQVSIADLQNSNHGFSSKQLLMPLLAESSFAVLRIVCGHVPPWLQVWIAEGRISGKIASQDQSESVVLVYGKQR